MSNVPTPHDAVSEIMTRDVLTLRPDQPLTDAIALLAEHHVRHVLVVDRGTLVGVLSDRDVFRAFLAYPDLERVPLSRVMRKPAVTVTSTTSLEDAARQLLDHRIHCLPVVDGPEGLAGILTTSDLLRTFVAGGPA